MSIISERLKRRPLWGISLACLAIWLAYLAIAVCTTWPLVARLTTHLPDGEDTLAHYWNGWWVWQAMREGRSPYYTPYLFYPAGISLVYKNLAWLHILPWLALRPLTGGIAAYNLTFLLHLALCGFAAFALAYELTGDGRAAFLAGLIYQCWPYRMTQPSHPNLMSTAWIPIFLLFLVRVVRRGRWQGGLLAGLSLALVGYTRWQLLIPAGVVGGVYLALTLPRSMGRRQIHSLLLAGAVTALALAPPAMLFLREWRTNPADLIIESEETMMQTDVLAYLTPPGSHPVFGKYTQPAYDRYYAERGSRSSFSPYVGVTAVVLALLGAWTARRRQSLPWIGMAVSLASLALGPVLRINGRAYPGVPMPYALAGRLYIVRLLRVPDRFNMSLALPVAVLAAYGIAHLIRRRKGWGAVALLCLAGGAISLEYLIVPFPLQSGQVSAFYRQLAAETGDFAVLNIPVDAHRSKPAMFAQTVHQHPILQGRTSRYPKGAFDYLKGQPWLRAMGQYSAVPPGQRDISRQLNALADDNVRYIILHKGLIGAEHVPRWKQYLAIEPRFEDEEIVVYATRPLAGTDFGLAPEIATGVGIVRAMASTDCLNPGLALEVDVAWGTTAPPGRNLDVELGLASADGVARTSAHFPIAGDWPAGDWPANAVAWGYYALPGLPALSAGVYDVTLALVDAEKGGILGQPVVVREVRVSEMPCTFPAPSGAVDVQALFGDALRLLGYRLQQGEGGLSLTLHWRSEQRMERDYKVFVHVFDPATGVPVAQDDAMPLRWTYPTTLWGAGEVVMDVVPISLREVPAGSYGVAIGVYDPASMERLPVVDANGQVQSDGRLILPGEEVQVGE
jgi:hypothetical protein